LIRLKISLPLAEYLWEDRGKLEAAEHTAPLKSSEAEFLLYRLAMLK
jgi:hypothetical protein